MYLSFFDERIDEADLADLWDLCIRAEHSILAKLNLSVRGTRKYGNIGSPDPKSTWS